MNNTRFILTHLDGNKYAVADTETGFTVTFLRGRWNTSQKVLPPENMAVPDGQDAALWAASAMRAIGDYMAVEHPDLVTFSDRERAHRDLFFATMQDTGAALAELREYNGLSIDDAAAAANYTPERVQRIEEGRIADKLTVVVKYVEAIGGRLAIIPQQEEDDPHCQFVELIDD